MTINATLLNLTTGDNIGAVILADKGEVRRVAAKASNINNGVIAINYTKSGRPGCDTEVYSNGHKVTLVKGNNKVGRDVYTLTFPAGCGCPKDCGCYTSGDCYGMNGCFVFENVKACHLENWLAFNASIKNFETALDYLIKAYKARAVRLLVAGDAEPGFPAMACRLAAKNPAVVFQEFTKKYDLWNEQIETNIRFTGKLLPDNYTLMYSVWPGYEMRNPYNMPVAVFVPLGDTAPIRATACGGCCSDCVKAGTGCIGAKPGEIIALYEHSTAAARNLESDCSKHVNVVYRDGIVYAFMTEERYNGENDFFWNFEHFTIGRDYETALCNLASKTGYTLDATRAAVDHLEG